MSEETQKQEAEVTEETTEETQADEIQSTDEAVSTTAETKDETDYKALFENEQNLRKKAEGKVQHLKKQGKETTDDTGHNATGIDVEDIAQIVREQVSEGINLIRNEVVGDRIANTISERAVSPEHAELVKYYYENSLKLTGNIEDDVDNAFALAEKKSIRQKLAQVGRADKSKTLKSKASQDAGAPSSSGSGPNTANLTHGMKRLIENGTFKYNAQMKRFESEKAKIWFKTDKNGAKSEEGRL